MKNQLTSQDRQMIEQCLNGSSKAWRSFIDQFSSLVYYSIKNVLKDSSGNYSKEELEDLHNDVFVSIMENRGKKLRLYEGKNGCSLSTWIRIIAVRVAIDQIRKKKQTISMSEESCVREVEKKNTDFDPVISMENDEKKEILKKIIEEMPSRDRLFIKLFYYENVSPKEMAKIYNTSISSVYSRGSYLKDKIKEKIRKKYSKE